MSCRQFETDASSAEMLCRQAISYLGGETTESYWDISVGYSSQEHTWVGLSRPPFWERVTYNYVIPSFRPVVSHFFRYSCRYAFPHPSPPSLLTYRANQQTMGTKYAPTIDVTHWIQAHKQQRPETCLLDGVKYLVFIACHVDIICDSGLCCCGPAFNVMCDVNCSSAITSHCLLILQKRFRPHSVSDLL